MMQVRGRGLGHIGSSVETREVVGGLSGPRGGSGAPRVCPELWNWVVSDASARVRLGPHWVQCQDERGFRGALGPEKGFGGSLGMPRAVDLDS